jgi:hypothetical protein
MMCNQTGVGSGNKENELGKTNTTAAVKYRVNKLSLGLLETTTKPLLYKRVTKRFTNHTETSQDKSQVICTGKR